MSYKFSNDKPIFLQIEEIIKKQIISGEISPGEKLKSVRELSAIFQVNPNTIQNALKNLENVGLIYTDRTNGKFVNENSDIIIKSKQEQIDQVLTEFIEKMKGFGLDDNQILKYLKEKMNGWFIRI